MCYFYAWLLTNLGCKNVEVSSAVGPANELALVLGGDPGVLGDPDHRGGKPVGVEAEPVKCLTLLLAVAFT